MPRKGWTWGSSTKPSRVRKRAETRLRQLRDVRERRLERLPNERRLLRIIAYRGFAELDRMEARGCLFTRAECAVQLGITREAVRQIESRLRDKLRAALLDRECTP